MKLKTPISTFLKNLVSEITSRIKDIRQIKKWPSRDQWLSLPRVLTKKEKIIIIILIMLIVFSGIFLIVKSYRYETRVIGDYGGTYIEGLAGQPRFINPILAQTNDADRDLTELIFSGLMRYNKEGEIITDLAEKYEIGEDGKTYTFYLKKALWHDGKPLAADDVVFTIKIIQDPEYKSPHILNWQGVRVEKVDDLTVRFLLNNAYAPFLQNVTQKIIPKHIWQEVPPSNFPLVEYNLKPIGSGPYKFKKYQKDASGSIQALYLESYNEYHIKKPFIDNITVRFYSEENAMLSSLYNKRVDGVSFVSAENISSVERVLGLSVYYLNIPQYFSIFFNQNQSRPLSDKTVRLALAYATDKQEIIDKVLGSKGSVIDSPIPPALPGYTPDTKIYDFALEHANNILEAEGWILTEENEGKIRKKGDDKLEINLVTAEWPQLRQTAEILKEQWGKIGARVNLNILSAAEVQQDYIRPREYEALLFGEILGYDPDPFSFWHSSQKNDPGLNLSLYDNKAVDKLLEEARQTLDEEKRISKYKEFTKLVTDDAAAIFLYSPAYLYVVDKKVKGIEVRNIITPSQRFSEIENWYIETKRIKK